MAKVFSKDASTKDPYQMLLDSMEYLEHVSYCPENLTGRPTKYPQYGDFADTYMLRSYGNWWKESEAYQPNYMPQDYDNIESEDYVICKFEYAVVPTKIIIYETFNPGAVVRLYGRLIGEEWFLLYEAAPSIPDLPPNTARCFEPKLNRVKKICNEIRIEFNQSLLQYYTALDAVLLAGYRPQSKLQLYILTKGLDNTPGPAYKQKAECKEIQIIDETEKGENHFNKLPYETMLHVFQYLDLKSLLRCGLVSKRFLEVTLDPTIYQAISLKKYWMKVDNETLKFFHRRGRMLRKLDLSWCGNNYAITENFFQNLLKHCGKQLTHLSLCNCEFARNVALGALSKCSELVDLRLRNCFPCSWSFIFLGDLTKLEALDVCGTSISSESLVRVLKANKNLKHLIIDYCDNLTQVDDVMEVLAVHNVQLRTLSCWKVRSLTARGVKSLARCRELRELDMGWCLVLTEPHYCLGEIAQGCKELRRLIVSNWRGLTDHEFLPIAFSCKKLTQLDLLGIRNMSPEVVAFTLASLPNLRLLELTFCEKITRNEVKSWRQMYPNVTILRQIENRPES